MSDAPLKPPRALSPRMRNLAPTEPFKVDPRDRLPDVFEKLSKVSFQGRNLGKAFQAWTDALETETTLLFGLSGAMTAGGMRNVMVFLIENRLVDCIVSTGANLFHDVYETLGHPHYIGQSQVDDLELYQNRLDRVFDTYADEVQFRKMDWYLGHFMKEVAGRRRVGTRELFQLLADRLEPHKVSEGIVTAARRHGVPLYCPAIADSSFGIAAAEVGFPVDLLPQIDVVRDVVETAEIAYFSKSTSVVYTGGGTPKNFINQSSLTAEGWTLEEMPGHDFAIQFTTDAPHWGGLSGCTFSEAQSWGKISERARMVTVHVDATIALPLLATALAQWLADGHRRKAVPDMSKLYGQPPITTELVYENVVDPESQELEGPAPRK
jgi:deoxyhypusine synthase